MTDKKLGKSVPADLKEDDPWPTVFRCLAQDEKFWAEQVVRPAVAWTAAGGKGVPVAAAEMIAGAQPGVVPPAPDGHSDAGAERKKQAKRDKRAAKRKRIQSEREELQPLRGQPRTEGGKLEGKKGGGKGKSKDQEAISFALAGVVVRGMQV